MSAAAVNSNSISNNPAVDHLAVLVAAEAEISSSSSSAAAAAAAAAEDVPSSACTRIKKEPVEEATGVKLNSNHVNETDNNDNYRTYTMNHSNDDLSRTGHYKHNLNADSIELDVHHSESVTEGSGSMRDGNNDNKNIMSNADDNDVNAHNDKMSSVQINVLPVETSEEEKNRHYKSNENDNTNNNTNNSDNNHDSMLNPSLEDDRHLDHQHHLHHHLRYKYSSPPTSTVSSINAVAAMTKDKIGNCKGIGTPKLENYEKQWMDRFCALKEYKEKYGDCLVSQRGPYPVLGRWVNKQRDFFKLFKEGKRTTLSLKRVEMLNNIGFAWSAKERKQRIFKRDDEKWMKYYSYLKAYKERHGNCTVRRKYRVDNLPLGEWVHKQRQQWALKNKGKYSTISQDRIDRLNDIDFPWPQHTIYRIHSSSKKTTSGHPDISSFVNHDEEIAVGVHSACAHENSDSAEISGNAAVLNSSVCFQKSGVLAAPGFNAIDMDLYLRGLIPTSEPKQQAIADVHGNAASEIMIGNAVAHHTASNTDELCHESITLL